MPHLYSHPREYRKIFLDPHLAALEVTARFLCRAGAQTPPKLSRNPSRRRIHKPQFWYPLLRFGSQRSIPKPLCLMVSWYTPHDLVFLPGKPTANRKGLIHMSPTNQFINSRFLCGFGPSLIECFRRRHPGGRQFYFIFAVLQTLCSCSNMNFFLP